MRRRFGLSLIFAAVLPLAAASAAWACGILATLKLDHTSASPGQAITATGVNYNTSAGASPVTLHLNSRHGAVLGTAVPNAGRQIATSFPVPAGLKPGWYVVLATQFTASGTPVAGTPGRTTLHVVGTTSHRRAVVAAPWRSAEPPRALGSPAGTTASASSGGTSMLVLLAAVALSLTLLISGLAILSSRRAQKPKPLRLGV